MRISDWSSDVCSSDLLPISRNTGDTPRTSRLSSVDRSGRTAARFTDEMLPSVDQWPTAGQYHGEMLASRVCLGPNQTVERKVSLVASRDGGEMDRKSGV